MEYGVDLLQNSKLICHFATNRKGDILYSNNAFKTTFTHIRPNHLQDFVKESHIIYGAMLLSELPKSSLEIIHVECKGMDGDSYFMAFEISCKNTLYNFVGFLSLDKQEYDENMFAILKKEMQQFKFEISHNTRSHLANIIGLNDIICKADNIEEVRIISGMMKKSAEGLDKAFMNLIDLIK